MARTVNVVRKALEDMVSKAWVCQHVKQNSLTMHIWTKETHLGPCLSSMRIFKNGPLIGFSSEVLFYKMFSL